MRPFLDFGRFLVAMMNSLGVSRHLQLDPPYRSRSSIGATIARCVSKMLKAVSEQSMDPLQWFTYSERRGSRVAKATKGIRFLSYRAGHRRLTIAANRQLLC